MELSDGFRYVDFATRAFRGFRNNVVEVGDVARLSQRYSGADCFCTYFLFDHGLRDHVRGNGHSVAGYRGSCYAHFLPLDIDSPDLGKALQTTREIARYLLDDWGVPENSVAAYFSGSKGFHLMVATGVFGVVESSAGLPQTFRELRRSMVKQARVSYPEAVDFSISDRMRLLRLPNTRHSGSGLYKIPLRIDEVLSAEPDEIRWRASRPRTPWLTDASGLLPRYDVEPVRDAVEMLARSVELAHRHDGSALPDPGTFLGNGHLSEALCEAELRLYREGVPEGYRSAMCLRLASRMRSAGYSKEEGAEMVASFAGRCTPPMEDYSARQIVEVAYRVPGRGYQFGCGTGNGDPAHTRLVYEACPHDERMECRRYREFANGRR